MGRRRQKARGKKRPKKWHRGWSEGRRYLSAADQLPDVGSGADAANGAPTPVNSRSGPKRGRGETL